MLATGAILGAIGAQFGRDWGRWMRILAVKWRRILGVILQRLFPKLLHQLVLILPVILRQQKNRLTVPNVRPRSSVVVQNRRDNVRSVKLRSSVISAEQERQRAKREGKWAGEQNPYFNVRINEREWKMGPDRIDAIVEQAREAAAEGVQGALEAVEQALKNIHINVPPVPPTPPRPATPPAPPTPRPGTPPVPPIPGETATSSSTASAMFACDQLMLDEASSIYKWRNADTERKQVSILFPQMKRRGKRQISTRNARPFCV